MQRHQSLPSLSPTAEGRVLLFKKRAGGNYREEEEEEEEEEEATGEEEEETEAGAGAVTNATQCMNDSPFMAGWHERESRTYAATTTNIQADRD